MAMGTDVLVVDDGEDAALALVMLLEWAGYSTTWARSAAEGWQVFRETAPRAVVADGGMPGGNAMQLAFLIKEASPTTPVVLLAVDPSEEAQVVCDVVLSKPSGGSKLVGWLRASGVTPR